MELLAGPVVEDQDVAVDADPRGPDDAVGGVLALTEAAHEGRRSLGGQERTARAEAPGAAVAVAAVRAAPEAVVVEADGGGRPAGPDDGTRVLPGADEP